MRVDISLDKDKVEVERINTSPLTRYATLEIKLRDRYNNDVPIDKNRIVSVIPES